MDIDEFLDTETAKLGGKSKIVSSPAASSGGSLRKLEEETLFEKLEMIKEQVKGKKILSAVRGFESVKSQYTDMTRKLLSENRYIFNQLLEINQDLAKSMQNQKSDVTKKTQLIKKLVADAITQLNSGNLSTANKINIEIQELLREIPDVFVEEKGEVKNEVTSFTVLLTKHLQKVARVEFQDKKKALEATIHDAYRYIEKSGGYLPYATFNDVNKMFMMLPDGFVYEKILLYIDILKLFRSSSLGEETRGVLETITKMHQTMQFTPTARPGRVALKNVDEAAQSVAVTSETVKPTEPVKPAEDLALHKEELKPVVTAPSNPPLSINLDEKKEELKPAPATKPAGPIKSAAPEIVDAGKTVIGSMKRSIGKIFGADDKKDEEKAEDAKNPEYVKPFTADGSMHDHKEHLELKAADKPKIDAPPVLAEAAEKKKDDGIKPLSLHGDDKENEPTTKKVAGHSKLSIDL